jgi:pantetheine-phosphate adenylyltransferase
MSMIKAVFAGSFDPPTNGHLDIINRTCKIFDQIDVIVSVNPQKKYLFTEDERFKMLEELTKDYSNVKIHICRELIVNYAKKVGASVLIRGIRSTNDFAYEFDLAHMNQTLNPDIETIFIPTKEKYAIVKSSSIKELAMFGGDISRMVPPLVENAIKEKYKSNVYNN